MVNQEQVLEILHAVGEKISEEKLFLTELDNVIGDGDHGINLARGFAEVEKKRPMMEGKDIGTMLKTAGMALVSTVGGASGPLYGTAFMQAGKALAGKTELDAQDLVTILDAFVAGVQLRGFFPAGDRNFACIRLCRAHKRARRPRMKAHGVLNGVLKFFHIGSL